LGRSFGSIKKLESSVVFVFCVRLGLTLHLLADLDVDVEELGHAAVETDGLALVEVALF
jgi:hypothetical protein